MSDIGRKGLGDSELLAFSAILGFVADCLKSSAIPSLPIPRSPLWTRLLKLLLTPTTKLPALFSPVRDISQLCSLMYSTKFD